MKLPTLLVCMATVAATASAQEQAAVLTGTLQSKNHFVELWNVDSESRYLVRNLDGRPLTVKISLAALARRFPDLAQSLEQGIADDASLSPQVLQRQIQPLDNSR